jgi:hypothetical protein
MKDLNLSTVIDKTLTKVTGVESPNLLSFPLKLDRTVIEGGESKFEVHLSTLDLLATIFHVQS